MSVCLGRLLLSTCDERQAEKQRNRQRSNFHVHAHPIKSYNCEILYINCMDDRRWLLLLHQIPPKPAYFRAKVLRRLALVGALPIKNSAYVLPDSEESLEDFEWLRQEIEQEGGAAWLFRSEVLAGMPAEQIEEAFRQLHTAEYEYLIEQGRELLQQSSSEESVSTSRKLSRRAGELRRIDFFETPLRVQLERLLEEIDRHLRADETLTSGFSASRTGRTWVTRKGVHVDRIASAWLIRRFIDPEASFRFVDATRYIHQADELRFDMFGGEFTHQGSLCTFEVLLSTHNLRGDGGLEAVAEVIHDIDLKDDQYQRAETAGVARLVNGLCSQTVSDELRIERGSFIFESLYRSFG